jgi:sec-independent protein translocase protein TatA
MFDPSAPHIIILLIVVLLLFGSRRLPGAARSLGESMHIFKKSVRSGADEDSEQSKTAQGTTVTMQQAALPVATPPQMAGQPQPYAAPTQEQQLADLQKQINDLQKQNVGTDGQPSD